MYKRSRWVSVLLSFSLVAVNPWTSLFQAAPPPVPPIVLFLSLPPETLCKGDSFTVITNIITAGSFLFPIVTVTAGTGTVNPPAPSPEGGYIYKFDYTAQEAGSDVITVTAINPAGGLGIGTLPVTVQNCRYDLQITGIYTFKTPTDILFVLQSIGEGETSFEPDQNGQINASGDFSLNDTLIVESPGVICNLDQPYQGQFPFTLSGTVPQNAQGQVAIHVSFTTFEPGPGSNILCKSPNGSGSAPIPLKPSFQNSQGADFAYPVTGGTDSQTQDYPAGPVTVTMEFVATLTREVTQ